MVEPLTVLGKRTHKKAEEDRENQLVVDGEGAAASHNDSKYVLRDGLRFVKPYSHEFKTFAKRRWIDKKLLDVFQTEFKAFSSEYYDGAITDGKITVNGKAVSIEYKIKEGDKIIHKTTRHETPVTDKLPQVVHDDEEFIAFNKPSSIPVHACGNFMYNTLLKITELEMNYPNLKTVHRLDRQTSGIIFFAKKDTSSNEFREAMIADKVSKVYYARVLGDFRKACGEQSTGAAAEYNVDDPEEEKKEDQEPGEEREKQKNGTVV